MTVISNVIDELRNNQSYQKRMAVTIVTAILLMLLYTFIFMMSAQDGETSGNLSHSISKECVELIETVAVKQWSTEFKEYLTGCFEHPIRKLAHFTEYMCMGSLLTVLFAQWIPIQKKQVLLILIWIALSAALDEYHQSFVAERSAEVLDVLLDTCGGMAGFLLTNLVIRILKHFRVTRAL